MNETTAGISIIDLGAVADGHTDNAAVFRRAAETLADCRLGTIHVPDGIFITSEPVRLTRRVSLCLAPSAVLRAAPDFQGDALVVKGAEPPPDHEQFQGHETNGRICGGILDGNKLPILGIRVPSLARLAIQDIEILNARAGGIHAGPGPGYELTLRGVRIALDVDGTVPFVPGSVGLRIEGISDNHVSQVLVIGYETGVWTNGSSSAFSQVHVWNGRNRPLKTAFHCAGWQDMYSQCQSDNFDGVAFLVDAPFQRFIGNFCQSTARFGNTGQRIGFRLTPRGTHGAYFGNFFNPSTDAPIQPFEGALEGSTILGSLYNRHVVEGQVNRIASDEGGAAHVPPLEVGLPRGV